ncbi:hypothetical protein CVD28_03040 [Bacillus sp. M6-12]|uniref:hypothetical protein n=1 Tax=Bacillus sp. M6-12 TaxID=2054166 RepID=UPI000C75F630|nr:hypothetical protein [Bacillus sp. M6-12]PLS19405.1 hypothetical protein CVD28_03040 [Bacillus sp. M6-12]
MIHWKKIHSIEDEDVLKFLGNQQRVAMRGEGYYAEQTEQDIYVLVVGNGVIIQIHNCSYIYIVVKKHSYIEDPFSNKSKLGKIYAYAIKEVHGSIEEQYWLKKYKEIAERDFGIAW